MGGSRFTAADRLPSSSSGAGMWLAASMATVVRRQWLFSRSLQVLAVVRMIQAFSWSEETKSGARSRSFKKTV